MLTKLEVEVEVEVELKPRSTVVGGKSQNKLYATYPLLQRTDMLNGTVEVIEEI